MPCLLICLLWQPTVCRFRERLEPFKAHLPEAAERVIEEELEKLQVCWREGRMSSILRSAALW